MALVEEAPSVRRAVAGALRPARLVTGAGQGLRSNCWRSAPGFLERAGLHLELRWGSLATRRLVRSEIVLIGEGLDGRPSSDSCGPAGPPRRVACGDHVSSAGPESAAPAEEEGGEGGLPPRRSCPGAAALHLQPRLDGQLVAGARSAGHRAPGGSDAQAALHLFVPAHGRAPRTPPGRVRSRAPGRAAPAPAAARPGWSAAGLAWCDAAAFYWVTGGRAPATRGLVPRGTSVPNGCWAASFRAITALTLHAEGHVFGNAVAALVLRLGAGPLAGRRRGAAGHAGGAPAATCWWRGPTAASHDSVGASTATFAALGLLGGLQIVRWCVARAPAAAGGCWGSSPRVSVSSRCWAWAKIRRARPPLRAGGRPADGLAARPLRAAAHALADAVTWPVCWRPCCWRGPGWPPSRLF